MLSKVIEYSLRSLLKGILLSKYFAQAILLMITLRPLRYHCGKRRELVKLSVYR